MPNRYPQGEYLLLFDPLDGSSQHRRQRLHRHHLLGAAASPEACPASSEDDFLQPGSQQVAAGYCVYGPQTTLVLTVGDGVAMFTLDREMGSWVLTAGRRADPGGHQGIRDQHVATCATGTPPVKRYIDECLAGKDGPRGKDFNMRWIASHGGRRAPHPDAAAASSCTPGTSASPRQAGQAAPDVRGQPDGASSSSRPAARRPTARSASSTSQPTKLHQRVSGGPRLEERGRARDGYHREAG